MSDKFSEGGFEEIDGELEDVYKQIRSDRPETGNNMEEDRRGRLIYDHLFDLVERAVYQCNVTDADMLCTLIEAFDNLYAIGLSMNWVPFKEEEEDV